VWKRSAATVGGHTGCRPGTRLTATATGRCPEASRRMLPCRSSQHMRAEACGQAHNHPCCSRTHRKSPRSTHASRHKEQRPAGRPSAGLVCCRAAARGSAETRARWAGATLVPAGALTAKPSAPASHRQIPSAAVRSAACARRPATMILQPVSGVRGSNLGTNIR